MEFKAVIIGCGRIGALKDDSVDSSTTENVLTHAHGIHNNPNIELDCFMDLDTGKAFKASEKWKNKNDPISMTTNIKMALESKPDIVVVAVSTEYHCEVLKEVAEYNPKIVIAEKPFCSNLEQATEIAELYHQKDIPIVVNYIRRFVPGLREFYNNIIFENSPADNVLCRVLFNGNLLESGCHAIDMMQWFFGGFWDVNNYFIRDNTASLDFKFCHSVLLTASKGLNYSAFEIDILTKNNRYRIIEKGNKILKYRIVEDPIYKTPVLSIEPWKIETTNLGQAFTLLYNDVVNYLKSDENISNVWDAVETHRILREIKLWD